MEIIWRCRARVRPFGPRSSMDQQLRRGHLPGRKLYETNFAETVIDALEYKVDLRNHYPTGLGNAAVATL
ncbi:MAG: hypothetical protein ACRD0W_10590 [Acidimicrobiales bacterium]